MRQIVRRLGIEKTDYWHRRLLRAHRERPSSRRAPEQRDEVAAPLWAHNLKVVGSNQYKSPLSQQSSGFLVRNFAHFPRPA
jgi:hypothetical protein